MSALFPVYPRLDLELASGHGAYVKTTSGRTILDLYGGHAVTPLGHGHRELADALNAAYRTLDFYSNSLHMPIQEQAAEAVLEGQSHLSRVHFVNSGTEANESALHLARRVTGRTTVVSLSNGFHGRTLASLSATGIQGYRDRLSVPVPESWSRRIDFGSPDLSAIDETVAAVILESVPSLGGVFMPPKGWYREIAKRCEKVGALLIVDEVQGGVGRLGTWFGHELLGVQPDIVTLAKSLGSGFPVGAMVTTEALAQAVGFGELGTTFGGGPMACTMVAKTAQIIRRDGLMERNVELFERIRKGLSGLEGVTVRGAGALIGVETPMPAGELRAALLERDILIGVSGHGHTARLLPPYILTDEQIDHFVQVAGEVLDA